jgi:dihydropteroate synthase
VFLYGVINASPDSLHEDSIATTPDAAVARARRLLAEGVQALDLGGQGSTDHATVVDWSVEWARLEAVVPALAALGTDLSVDSWRPEVVRRALQAGATVINAADGMQSDAMWEVAAEFDVPIVVPFLSGPNPREMVHVRRDPVEAIVEFFEARLADADRYGLRHRCIVDPGTGFAPSAWPWEERYRYQKRVYSNLDALRRFGLPLYIALPWKDTVQHDELLEIVVRQQPEFGRAHRPAHVRDVEARVHGQSPSGPRGETPSGGNVSSQPTGHRSGATSASGARTNRRSPIRGCGIVSSGDDSTTSS